MAKRSFWSSRKKLHVSNVPCMRISFMRARLLASIVPCMRVFESTSACKHTCMNHANATSSCLHCRNMCNACCGDCFIYQALDGFAHFSFCAFAGRYIHYMFIYVNLSHLPKSNKFT